MTDSLDTGRGTVTVDLVIRVRGEERRSIPIADALRLMSAALAAGGGDAQAAEDELTRALSRQLLRI